MEHYYEIVHSGVKGQKWGERRYQNRDGSRTALGQQHRRELEGYGKGGPISAIKRKLSVSKSSSKKTSTKPKVEQKSKSKSKTEQLREMSDKELNDRSNRLQAEITYLERERRYSALTAKEATAGRKFVNAMMKEVIGPAAEASGKEVLQAWLTQNGKAALGIKSSNKK